MRITLLEACQVALALSGLLILSACGSAATTPTPATPSAAPVAVPRTPAPSPAASPTATAGATPATAGTPWPGAANPTPATGVAILAGTAVAAPAATTGATTPTETVAGTPSATRRVTLDDGGQTLQLQAGQRFLLALGTGFDWTVTVGDPYVVSRVADVPVPEGAQGIYEAKQPGRTTLTAVGDPPCRKATPPCGAPSRLFRVEIVVR